MTNRYDDKKFGDVVRDYVRGAISRRQFIVRGAQLGLSAAVLAKLTQPSRAAANLIQIPIPHHPSNLRSRPSASRSSRPSPTRAQPST